MLIIGIVTFSIVVYKSIYDVEDIEFLLDSCVDGDTAWFIVDGNNLSELLLVKGLAEVKYIYGDYKYIDKLREKQYEAYNKKLGI